MTKTLLVTSALPYANGDIHLGHLVEHVQTDIFVRFQKHLGHACYYMCADDAHGTAIMLSAEKDGVTPDAYIDAVKAQHISDFKQFNIDYDHYYSTHSEENRVLSESIYNAANDDGGIIKKDIQQYFDEDKGLFLADRYIKGTCPKCGATDQYGDACEVCYATYSATELVDPVSALSGKPPVLKESTHYFFDLEKYREHITQWLATDPVSDPVKNKLNEWLTGDLKPWDISRDAPYFGFKIPGTDDKYFYVWLDAPIGYIATTESWATANGKTCHAFWKNDAVEIHHFIGKDIMYFHTLFWPAMLAVSGFNQPKKVHIHGFLTVNGEKMSKSRGTFILARDYAKLLNPDILRYYYAAKLSSSMDDIDFNLEDFVQRINSDVLGKFINIGSRIGAIVTKKLDGQLSTIDAEGLALLDDILAMSDAISDAYQSLDTHKGMRMIMQCAELANKYIDDKAPWALVKDNADAARVVCTVALNALRILCIYLAPVMPGVTQQLFSFLGVSSQHWAQLPQHITNATLAPYEHVLKRLTLDDVAPLVNTTQ
ncbi:MAG: methionine--tRNA ligase [Candidatus Margulisbacteria bacterium]|nr:methionine--tRNA ligase [Candidatus Margulisiibacteriota bacterium]